MWRKSISFILHRRLEDVLAAGFSLLLLAIFSTGKVSHTVQIPKHDIAFLMLPISVLGLKVLFNLLLAPEVSDQEDPGVGNYLVAFFQPLARLFRDWCPFVLLSACYYSMYSNFILHLNPHPADAMLARFDAALLGNQPSFLLEKWITPWTTDFFNLVYFSYVLSLPVVAFYCYTRKGKGIFRRVMMGYLTLMLMGVMGYLSVPAAGPEAFFSDRYTQDLSGHAMSRGVEYIIGNGRVAYDCFPSLHVAIPLLLCFYAREYTRKLFLPVCLYVLAMCFAVLYLRYHYLADVVAAFAFAPVAYWLNDFLLAHWPGERIVAGHKPAGEPALPLPVEPV
jgi:hypothetical protein